MEDDRFRIFSQKSCACVLNKNLWPCLFPCSFSFHRFCSTHGDSDHGLKRLVQEWEWITETGNAILLWFPNLFKAHLHIYLAMENHCFHFWRACIFLVVLDLGVKTPVAPSKGQTFVHMQKRAHFWRHVQIDFVLFVADTRKLWFSSVDCFCSIWFLPQQFRRCWCVTGIEKAVWLHCEKLSKLPDTANSFGKARTDVSAASLNHTLCACPFSPCVIPSWYVKTAPAAECHPMSLIPWSATHCTFCK